MDPHRRPPGYKEGRDWQWRCLLGTAIGGVAGTACTSVAAAAGLMGSMRGNALGAMAVNATLASACLAGSEELVRELRSSGAEDGVNAVIGGALSGYSLGMMRGGRALAPAATLVFAILGFALHEAVGSVQSWRHLQMLNGEDTALQDQGVLAKTQDGQESAEEHPQGAVFELPKWFPIRPATPEELKKHEERMARRRQSLLDGDGDNKR